MAESTEQKATYTWSFALRVVLKAAVLFVVLNILFAMLNPLPTLGRISLYNVLLPGRVRLPYGENPVQSYNISLFNIPAMFASHVVSQSRVDNEFRVLIVGDSNTWGWLLRHDETLAAQINRGEYMLEDGRHVLAYNLGYPELSLMKDLLLLDYALRYEPDLIIWPVTLRSFRPDQQHPALVQQNPKRVRPLIADYDLALDADNDSFVERDFLERTIVGQRRALADLLRLQIYGVAWAITGIDQHIAEDYDLRASDFEEDATWNDITEPRPLTRDELAFDILAAGVDRAGDVPVLLVNEPIFISSGENSHLHYNFWYPRWAYDSYREMLSETADTHGWELLDLWNEIASVEFTDSPVHLTSEGTRQYADLVAPAMLELVNSQ